MPHSRHVCSNNDFPHFAQLDRANRWTLHSPAKDLGRLRARPTPPTCARKAERELFFRGCVQPRVTCGPATGSAHLAAAPSP